MRNRGDLVLEIDRLSVDYGEPPSAVHAVKEVSLRLHRGEVLGLAGESGSGKSTLAYAATRLLRSPGRVVEGSVRYFPVNGPAIEVLEAGDAALGAWRWEKVSIVFQAAMNALNPVAPIITQLTDTIAAHRPQSTREHRLERASELLDLVAIPRERMRAYPHQLSGGMRQRVMIAMALALEPEVVILDEPTTALDVVVQREILIRLDELRQRLGFAMIFITHDLSLLLEIADEIAIFYAGRIVERGDAEAIYSQPQHPYTAGLLASFPSLVGKRQVLSGISGFPPDLRRLPPGCAFHPRCPEAAEACRQAVPELIVVEDHEVACFARHPSMPSSRPERPVPEPVLAPVATPGSTSRRGTGGG